MSDSAKLFYKGQEFEFPVIIGTENEPAIDIAKLRSDTGLITIDSGFKNTGSTTSSITFLDRRRDPSIQRISNRRSCRKIKLHGSSLPTYP